MGAPTVAPRAHGLRANLAQFLILVVVNGLVGCVVGIERGSLPSFARAASSSNLSVALIAFVGAFGLSKSCANRLAGRWCDTSGRKRVLVTGWLIAVPLPALLAVASDWRGIAAANVLLGMNQAFAWSAVTNMKSDLAGERFRGFAAGVSQTSGYVMVGVAAAVAGHLVSGGGPRPVLVLMCACIATGLVLSTCALDETSGLPFNHPPQPGDERFQQRPRSCVSIDLESASLAGLMNNLSDGSSWVLFPALFASLGFGEGDLGSLVAVYPGVWGASQLFTGMLSDRLNRRKLVIGGLLLEAVSLSLLGLLRSKFGVIGSCGALGVGNALVNPTLLAAVGDAAGDQHRATWLGVYRFWRDLGYVFGALGVAMFLQFSNVRAALWTIALLFGLVAAFCCWRAVGVDAGPVGVA